jgi:DNA-binding CsgD family transcriptional regulator
MIQDARLSKREKEVVDLVLQGKGNKQIALSLGISVRTVEFHLKNIYAKFQVGSRIELILNLGNFTGDTLTEKLGYSTVDKLGENTENRGRFNSRMNWATSFKNTVSRIGKELKRKNLMKNPSAFIPLGMSFAALATVLVHVALFGVAREADEGAAAHIWQILMAAQIPIIAFFAIKWLPRTPKQALLVLALQAGAVLAAMAPVLSSNFRRQVICSAQTRYDLLLSRFNDCPLRPVSNHAFHPKYN